MRRNTKTSLISAVLLTVAFYTNSQSVVLKENAGNAGKSMARTLGKSQQIKYFRSADSAFWHTARQDCFDLVGGTLAYIETPEELTNITKFLDDGTTATLYWIGGEYDTIEEQFIWGNGIPLSSDAPWAPNHPNEFFETTKVELYTVGRLRYRTRNQNTPRRYLCEVPVKEEEAQPDPCNKDNQLLIIVDSSGSISQAEYNTALEFAARLATTWADNANNSQGVMIFSDTAKTIISLEERLSKDEMRNRIYSAPYLGGGTSTDLALIEAAAEFEQVPNPGELPRNMLFLTGGQSSYPEATKVAAEIIKWFGIRSFAVGVSQNVNPEQLLIIAGNETSRVFNTKGSDDLLKLLQPVSQKVCE